ncbi:MAG: HAD hydrolase-like protein, partial [Mesosutterella sp.]|nr:HAD hydrolase-like protein [Mesosutterella sp.]
ALTLVLGGSRLIATNADITGPGSYGLIPATGAMVSPIEIASGQKAYFVGKPNPLMLRRVMDGFGVHASQSVMIGDSMGTDIRGGLETGMCTVLVLSGLTKRESLAAYAYRPDIVIDGVGDLVP